MAANTNEFADLSSANSEENIWDEEVICRLQAYIRACLIRKKYQDVRRLYEEIVSEVEEGVSRKPSVVRWQTRLPCNPRHCQNPRKTSTVGKVRTRDAPLHQTPHSSSERQPAQDTDPDVKGQASSLNVGAKGRSVADNSNSKSDTVLASFGDECSVIGATSRSEDVVEDQTEILHRISSGSLSSASHPEEVLPELVDETSPRLKKDLYHQGQTLPTRDDGSPEPDGDSDSIVNFEAENLPEKDGLDYPRLEEDPARQKLSSAHSGDDNELTDRGLSSKQSDTVSENSSTKTRDGSQGSSVEYTPDIESYSGTATPEALSSISSAEPAQSELTSAKFSVTPVEMHTPSRCIARIVDGQREGTEPGIDAGRAGSETTGGWGASEELEGEDLEAGRGVLLDRENRSGEAEIPSVAEISGVADMTSIWSNEETLPEILESDYPSDLEELQTLHRSVALELLWVQQAIISRKNYLRLKSNWEPSAKQES